MKKILGLFVILNLGLSLCSFISSEFTSDQNSEVQDYELMLGEFKLEELKSSKNKAWFTSGYEDYSPKQKVVKDITHSLAKEEFHISVYMGTWCPDSRREFPHLVKILDQADFDLDRLRIIGVNRDKIVPDVTDKKREKLNITNVPTIIVYDKEGTEVNRFVEFAQESLEEDVLKIVSGKDYKHVYDF